MLMTLKFASIVLFFAGLAFTLGSLLATIP